MNRRVPGKELKLIFCRVRAVENRTGKINLIFSAGDSEAAKPFCYHDSMRKKGLSPGALHPIPADLRKTLLASPKAQAAWEDITPLARNEWICWVTSVKKPETRKNHVERVRAQLIEGARRPCCWPGCPHR